MVSFARPWQSTAVQRLLLITRIVQLYARILVRDLKRFRILSLSSEIGKVQNSDRLAFLALDPDVPGRIGIYHANYIPALRAVQRPVLQAFCFLGGTDGPLPGVGVYIPWIASHNGRPSSLNALTYSEMS